MKKSGFKRVEEASGASTLLKGIPEYIAPELYGLTEWGTPYARDIWAVGATLFFMLVKRPVFESFEQLSEYAPNIEHFPNRPLVDVGATHLSIEFISSLMRTIPWDRPPTEIAILHEWLRPIPNHAPSWQMSNSTQASSQSPIDPMTEEFVSEFRSWDTEPLLTLGDSLHQKPNGQRGALSTEILDVAVHCQTISACGGVV
ncbi:hypothetical protein N7471_009536 [Penicillium samsonianum]|uniref:uncharacterized protein n=1 Tax=Penicillium samsonianum TaxID=1882272 RepID=UPI0025499A3B|nr:uncharacterized protein N7471_009536 [Penicillium samsonianum]KAJ6128319.1 hypothetical protein N7471_009536 [Penicillium samsonianum]